MKLFFILYIFCLPVILFSGGIDSFSAGNNNRKSFIKTDRIAGIFNIGYLGQNTLWVDLNSDGCLDLVTSNTDRMPPNFFVYQNNCDGTFELLNEKTGIPREGKLIISSSAGDFDNDGLVDIVLGTNSFYMVPSLYKNIGEFHFVRANDFTNVYIESLAKTMIFVDYNLDGYLDIFQSSYDHIYLYTNDGAGFFTESSAKSNLDMEFKSLNSAHWFDFNNDMFPDLFLSIDGYNRLFMNNKDGTFSDVSADSGLLGDEKWDSVAACSGDIDNDGDMDLFVVNIGSERNSLYINNGEGMFSDITLDSGISGIGDGRTCSVIDYNADGLNDIFTTNHIRPSRLYKNLGGNKFEDVAFKNGIHEPIDAFSVTWGDFNGDAVLDVFLNGHIGHALYAGTATNNSIVIELIGDGVKTNTSAIGSRIELISASGIKQSKAVSGGKGCCENDMLPVHFGLGDETEFEFTVKWTSGNTCTFEKLNAGSGRIYKVWEAGCKIFSY